MIICVNALNIRTQETNFAEGTGVISSALKMEPDQSVYDINGYYNSFRDSVYQYSNECGWCLENVGDDNPVALANEIEDQRITDHFQTTFSVDLDISKHINFRSVLGGFAANQRWLKAFSLLTNEGSEDNGDAEIDGIRNSFFLSTNYLTYSRVFKEQHDCTLMAGYSYEYDREERWQIEAEEFIISDISVWVIWKRHPELYFNEVRIFKWKKKHFIRSL